jgi:hypothetical protein
LKVIFNQFDAVLEKFFYLNLAKKKPKGVTLIKKYKFFFFLLKIIKNCLKVILNQFDAVLEKKKFFKVWQKNHRSPCGIA